MLHYFLQSVIKGNVRQASDCSRNKKPYIIEQVWVKYICDSNYTERQFILQDSFLSSHETENIP